MPHREELVLNIVDSAMAMEVDVQTDVRELLRSRRRSWETVKRKMNEMRSLFEKFGQKPPQRSKEIDDELAKTGDPSAPEHPQLAAVRAMLESIAERMEQVLGPRFIVGSLRQTIVPLREGLDERMDFRIVRHITELIRRKVNTASHGYEDELYKAAEELSYEESVQDEFVSDIIESAEEEALRRIFGRDMASDSETEA